MRIAGDADRLPGPRALPLLEAQGAALPETVRAALHRTRSRPGSVGLRAPGYHEPMAVDVLTEVSIQRPVAEVAAFAGDPSHAPEWYVNIKSVEWQTPPPLAVGSRIAFVAHFLGRRLAYTYEIREWVPGARLVMSTAEGPFPMETTYTWAAEGEGTRMTLRNRGQPTGFSAWMAPIMATMMRRANTADLAKLKTVLEGDGTA